MNLKNYQLVFDYDNTLAEKGGRISSILSRRIINLILKDNKVSIITSRSMLWMKDNGIDIFKIILSGKKKLSSPEIRKIIKNLVIYTGRGNEKFFPSSFENKLCLLEDLKYNRFMTIEDISLVQEAIKKSVPKKVLSGKTYLKQYLSYNLNGIFRAVMRINEISPKLKKEIYTQINFNLGKNKRISNILIDMEGNYIGFSFKNKAFAIKDILKNNPNKIIYYGDSPKGNDKPVFDLANGKLKNKINFIIVENPAHTLSLMKCKNESSLNYSEDQLNVLEVLTIDTLNKNIRERLENYWECANLPFNWISSILEILKKYHYNEDLAIQKVQEKFPSFIRDNSKDYSQKLIEFRKRKVENLSRRIIKDISGEIIIDVGGRNSDFIENIISLNKSVKRAYVTDIGSFSSMPSNTKINFVVQPSLRRIPFPVESINTVILSMVLHHLGDLDQKKLIESISSSLKKSGKIILIEDSYPKNKNVKGHTKNVKNFLSFNSNDKKKILSFYDWFGNRLMRNRDNIALVYNHKTMEEWKRIFEKSNLKEIKAEFIKEDKYNPDLFPPKAIIVFQKKESF